MRWYASPCSQQPAKDAVGCQPEQATTSSSQCKPASELPTINGERPYYILERVHRSLMFSFEGEPIGESEDVSDYSGKRCYCIGCDRILPKRMIKNIEGC